MGKGLFTESVNRAFHKSPGRARNCGTVNPEPPCGFCGILASQPFYGIAPVPTWAQGSWDETSDPAGPDLPLSVLLGTTNPARVRGPALMDGVPGYFADNDIGDARTTTRYMQARFRGKVSAWKVMEIDGYRQNFDVDGFHAFQVTMTFEKKTGTCSYVKIQADTVASVDYDALPTVYEGTLTDGGTVTESGDIDGELWENPVDYYGPGWSAYIRDHINEWVQTGWISDYNGPEIDAHGGHDKTFDLVLDAGGLSGSFDGSATVVTYTWNTETETFDYVDKTTVTHYDFLLSGTAYTAGSSKSAAAGTCLKTAMDILDEYDYGSTYHDTVTDLDRAFIYGTTWYAHYWRNPTSKAVELRQTTVTGPTYSYTWTVGDPPDYFSYAIHWPGFACAWAPGAVDLYGIKAANRVAFAQKCKCKIETGDTVNLTSYQVTMFSPGTTGLSLTGGGADAAMDGTNHTDTSTPSNPLLVGPADLYYDMGVGGVFRESCEGI